MVLRRSACHRRDGARRPFHDGLDPVNDGGPGRCAPGRIADGGIRRRAPTGARPTAVLVALVAAGTTSSTRRLLLPPPAVPPGRAEHDHRVGQLARQRLLPRLDDRAARCSAGSATSSASDGCCSSRSAIFVVGSIGAVVAPDIRTLIACRAVQGLGGAVFPLSVAILKDELPPLRLPVAVGIISTVFAARRRPRRRALGADRRPRRPGGSPFAVIAVLSVVTPRPSAGVVVPESPGRVAGAGRRRSGPCCSRPPSSPSCSRSPRGSTGAGARRGSSALLAVASAAAAAWVAVELRVAAPMVDMRMLVHRPVLLANGAAFVLGGAARRDRGARAALRRGARRAGSSTTASTPTRRASAGSSFRRASPASSRARSAGC